MASLLKSVYTLNLPSDVGVCKSVTSVSYRYNSRKACSCSGPQVNGTSFAVRHVSGFAMRAKLGMNLL